jgi:hypothetical protein
MKKRRVMIRQVTLALIHLRKKMRFRLRMMDRKRRRKQGL